MRLHSRVYLHSLVVLLVVGVATSLVFAMVNRGGAFREMGERMALHAAGLAAERLGEPAALASRVERLHADFDLDVTVRDLDGRVLARAGVEETTPATDVLSAARAGQVVARGRPVPYALAPVRDPASGTIVATVQISARRRFGPASLCVRCCSWRLS